ncbi:hypothetical protein [Bacteroides mediterraneensis]|uniref:hypothetical protein n=1 Tax=Bacteroides mediterraneensis TaxID=1841856 RepID=UPI0009324684|nr:hypothetical protein [Bacteroides mediterraneensis]
MIQQRLQQWIEHPELLGTESLYELKRLLERYPYFQTARILYLKNLFLLHDPSFQEELCKGALFVADLSVLFYAIEGEHFIIRQHAEKTDIPAAGAEDRTLDLIDRFLSDTSGATTNSLLPLPAEAVDYTSVLAEEFPAEDAETVPLKGQELIDNFIEKASKEEGKGEVPLMEDTSFGEALPLKEEEEKPQEKEEEPEQSETEQSEPEDEENYFTETLAKIYVKQQRYDKALEIIKKLNLKYPKKNTYFADQIRFLEKLIINAKSK